MAQHLPEPAYVVSSVGEASSGVANPVGYLHPELQAVGDVDPRLLHAHSSAQHTAAAAAAAAAGHGAAAAAAEGPDGFPMPGVGGAPDEEIRDQDRFLPIANVARVMKRHIPVNGKISKEAKECMQECVSEFISFLTSEACDRCQAERRKTITGEDILFSMQVLGFDSYLEPLKHFLISFRENIRGTSGGKFDLPTYEPPGGATVPTVGAALDPGPLAAAAGDVPGVATAPPAGVASSAGPSDSYMDIGTYPPYVASEAGGEEEFIDVAPSALHTGRVRETQLDEDGTIHVMVDNAAVANSAFPTGCEAEESDFALMPSSELNTLRSSAFG